MAIYKDRKLVPVAETWNLQDLLGKKTIEQSIEETLKKVKQLLVLYKKRFSSLEAFVKYCEASESFAKISRNTQQYLRLHCEQDTLSPYRAKISELSMQLQPYYEAFAAEEAEAIKNKALIQKYLKDDRLKNLRRNYELIFRNEPHTLPEDLAKYKAQVSQAFQQNYQIFSILRNAETKYVSAKDAKGKEHDVTPQTYSTLMKSSDRTLRKNTYESYQAGSLTTKETYAKLLSGHFLAEHRMAQSVNFKDQVEASLYDDNVDSKLVESLYKAAKANFEPNKRYGKATRTFLAKRIKIKYEQVMPYDFSLEIFPNDKDYSVKDAIKLVQDSVKPLGKQYADQVKKAFESRWVDFHMTPNKRSGAFSSTNISTEIQPILTNFDGTLGSVSTLAHEIGHSMHSYNCIKSNPYPLGNYPIFTAEVASNFSELLLTEEILRSSDDDKVKFNAIKDFLDNFAGSVYRQLMFSEFEYSFSNALVANQPLNTWEQISSLYRQINEPYLVSKEWERKYPNAFKLGAVTVPHYYYGFYVYKYAIGMIGSLTLMDILKKDQKKGAENYLKFISSGSNRWPADILKSVGVDLYDQKTLKNAFDLFEHYVGIYADLGRKILKINGKI